MSKDVRLEFFVEPFAEGEPGPHVEAAVKAAERAGLEVEVGPFSSQVTGPVDRISEAISHMTSEAVAAGATRISIQLADIETSPTLHVGNLQGALDRMILHVESELGGPLADLDRGGKQAAVRMLDERGAFLLRKAVEDVADRMGVSRITIYNYLDAIRDRS